MPTSEESRLHTYYREAIRAAYLALSGLETFRSVEIVERYKDVFTPEAIRRERDATKGGGEMALLAQKRLRCLTSGYVHGYTANLEDRLAQAESEIKLHVTGKEIEYHQAPGLLRRTADHPTRRQIGFAYARAKRSLVPLATARWEQTYACIKDLDLYSTYAEACAEWNALDLERAVYIAETVLAATDDLHRDRLQCYANSIGVTGRLHFSDAYHLSNRDTWNTIFSEDRLAIIAQATVARFAASEAQGRAISLDIGHRVGKAARAFCAPLHVPNDIVISIRPSSGPSAYEEVLHEIGHALHFSHVSERLPWELRYLPDDAVAESFAYLVASLLRDPFFLINVVGLPEDAALPFIAQAEFAELHLVRTYCAKVCFEIDLHSKQEFREASPCYERHMQRALGYPVPGAFGIVDMDSGLYAVEYLLAWSGAGALHRSLHANFGDRWSCEPEAWRWLRTLWSRAGMLRLDDLIALSESLDGEVDLILKFVGAATSNRLESTHPSESYRSTDGYPVPGTAL
jgi:hypothetical protein